MSLFSKTITLRAELTLSDEEFVQLRNFIYSQCGIFVADNRKYLLENRLANRVRELSLNSFGEYLSFLRYDPGRKAEMPRLFEAVTTNETSFYRNPPQLKIFEENILPEVVARQKTMKDRRLRIWSAGCSTGEEPYTLAIIAMEVLGSELPLWDVRVTANDLSDGVIAAARRGVYSDYSLRTTPRQIVGRYFAPDGTGKHKINQEVRRLVSFGSINLSDKYQMKRVERSHVVFCRNVIIYFDEEMKKQVIGCLYDNLLNDGFMFIGHSESLHSISRAFKPLHFSGSIVYKREE
jgi:chemotaxis protein methyltransferase CheR